MVFQQTRFPLHHLPLAIRSSKNSQHRYVFHISAKLHIKLNASSGIKVYHCSNQKIYQLLYTHKDKTDINLKPGVYRISRTCGKVYIGETGRNLKVRQKEHKDCCLKCQPDKSALAKHAWENDHPIKWNDSELLVPVRNYFSR